MPPTDEDPTPSVGAKFQKSDSNSRLAMIEDFEELEQFLCQIRNRRDRFGGENEDALVRYGHAGMYGRLIGAVIKFFASKRLDVPTQAELGEMLNPPVNQTVLGNFLKGKPSGKEDWVKRADDLLRILLLDTVGRPVPGAPDVYRRINNYFFRNIAARTEKNPTTPYFEPNRRRFGEPCSPRELAGEIEYFCREYRRVIKGAASSATDDHGAPVRIVWVAGGSFYFPGGHNGIVGNAMADASKAGVNVCFIRHSQQMTKEAQADHRAWKRWQRANRGAVREIDLGTKEFQNVPGWWECLSPALRYLYLSAARKDGTEEALLYIVRGDMTDEELTRHYGPLAIQANWHELTTFQEWLKRIDDHARAAAVRSTAPPVA